MIGSEYMDLSVNLISDIDGLSRIEHQWNNLVNNCSQNPILLSGFIKQFMEFNSSMGWIPLILTFSEGKRLVGAAPLRIKKKLGIKFVRFLLRNWFSPDFIIDEKYRQICMQEILNILFRTFKNQFAELVFPHNSKNLKSLRKSCRETGVFYSIKNSRIQWSDMRHSIIPVNCSWDEFVKSRGRNFIRKFKKIKKKLDMAGQWSAEVFENEKRKTRVLDIILDIEKRSWKHEWRVKKGLTKDHDLFIIIDGSINMSRLDSDFKWYVWFLRIKDVSIAYTLILKYKQTAYIVKTSYDKKYKKYHPGIFINNIAIRHLFHTKNVLKIDWLTDLPFHRNWTSISFPRIRVLVSRKTLPILLGYIYASDCLREFLLTIPLTGERFERRDSLFL